MAWFGISGRNAAIGAEKYEYREAGDLIKRLKDATRQAEILLKAVGVEERATVHGALRGGQKAELFEEREIVRLLNDFIYGFRDLTYFLYAQIREERAKGRQQIYVKFRGILEREIGTLIAELQKLRQEEAKL